ncbi:MAG TPA: CARDB domain-containing protein [Gemmatimonadaceae bacterium]|nr:CARDB domain-containing protein [Gemmatimonadaceae bacterium]
MRSSCARALWLVVVCLGAYARPAAAAPDLTVTAMTGMPSSINAGRSFTVSSTVAASGDAVGSFTVGFFLSTDGNIDPSDELIGSRTVTSLAIGASSTASSTLTIPAGVAPGQYYVGALADLASSVVETDEMNNGLGVSSIAIRKPDLTLTGVSASPTTLGAGGQVSITTTVLATAASATSFVVRHYLSPNAEITASDTALSSRTVSSLAEGASSTATAIVTLPASLNGPFYLGAIVDANGQVDAPAKKAPRVFSAGPRAHVRRPGTEGVLAGLRGRHVERPVRRHGASLVRVVPVRRQHGRGRREARVR